MSNPVGAFLTALAASVASTYLLTRFMPPPRQPEGPQREEAPQLGDPTTQSRWG